MSARGSQSPESVVGEIQRNTRRMYSTEEKVCIVLGGLKGEHYSRLLFTPGRISIIQLCRGPCWFEN